MVVKSHKCVIHGFDSPLGYTASGVCKVCERRRASVRRAQTRIELRTKKKTKRLALRDEILLHYSAGQNKCALCSENRKECLAIDHTYGDGREHRETVGRDIYPWLKRNGFPTGFRVLCHNCNFLASRKESVNITKKTRYSKKVRIECLSHYSNNTNSCDICGNSNFNVLTIDHQHGGGRKHLLLVAPGGGSNFYIWLRKNRYPIGYSVLCFSCNTGRSILSYSNSNREQGGKIA